MEGGVSGHLNYLCTRPFMYSTTAGMFPHLPPYGGDVQPACVHLLQLLHRLDERVSGNQPKQKLLFGYQGREGVAMRGVEG